MNPPLPTEPEDLEDIDEESDEYDEEFFEVCMLSFISWTCRLTENVMTIGGRRRAWRWWRGQWRRWWGWGTPTIIFYSDTLFILATRFSSWNREKVAWQPSYSAMWAYPIPFLRDTEYFACNDREAKKLMRKRNPRNTEKGRTHRSL